jgi:hypothetical protein
VEAREEIAPPLLGVELRDHTGALLARSEQSLSELGWDGRSRADVRFDVEHLPLVDGRYQFNLTLTDETRSRRYHTMEKAAEFAVHPKGDARGVFLFEGEWSLDSAPSAVTAPSRAPDPS